jgi:hypothetical protein
METLSTTEPARTRVPNPAEAHALRQAREAAETAVKLAPSNDEGIGITANSFDVEPLTDEPEQSAEQPTTDIDALPLNTEASAAEQDSTPEKKKKVWFKRLGYAASMNFKIARGIGIKNYAGEIKDSIQTAVSEKIDAAKAKVYQKTEETLWKLADDINATTEKVTGTYKRTKGELGAEYTAFKQGFTADLENAMGMWIAYREQARIDKEARKKYVNDRIMKYALQREKQFALAGTHGAGL